MVEIIQKSKDKKKILSTNIVKEINILKRGQVV